MATIMTVSYHTKKKVLISWEEAVLPQVKQCEKKTFHSSEIFDFDSELKKRNVEMTVIVDDHINSATDNAVLVAYMVLVHSKLGNAVILHKICIQQNYRRQGIARQMLESEIEKLKRRGCAKLHLWVSAGNGGAQHLYEKLGLEEVRTVDDYYAPGRAGISMSMDLFTRE